MGRTAGGWRLFRRPNELKWRVSFSYGKRQYKLSTGKEDDAEARVVAARLYAETVSGRTEKKPKRQRNRVGTRPLGEVAADWLTAIDGLIDADTAVTWALYAGTHWEPFFKTFEAITTESAREYALERLKSVKGSTVRKELGALRRFLEWRYGEENAPFIRGIKKKVQGTAHPQGKRTRTELSPEECWSVIFHLDKQCAPRFGTWPIRAYFVVAYETGLRPATVAALSVPEHYTKGDSELRIPPELDKARAGRPLPLSSRARAALDGVCPESGVIFGEHDYRDALERAALRAGLADHKRATLHPYDFRSAFGTHMAEETTNLVGLQYLMGHASIATTARYVKPSKRAALAALESAGRITGDYSTEKP